jgi:formylglycine-generating enzyme required for sulfatase activity
MARARLDELKKTQAASVIASPVPPKATAPGASVAPAASAPPAAPKPENRAAPSVYEAAQEWAKTRETTNPSVLEAFLGRFSDTIYGPMARDRLRELKSAQVAVVVPPASAPKGPNPTVPAVAAPPARMPVPPAATPAVGLFPASRSATPLTAAEEQALKPRDSFTECAHCPEMVVVPAGAYTMGSPAAEEGRTANEGPQSAVTFAKVFAAGKYAVTFEQWDACVSGGGCNGYRPSDEGRPRGRHPVVNVSWEDAEAYVAWLSKSTGKPYRLLSEAEREYVTRAGSTTPFWWGPSISTEQANYDGTSTYGGGKKGEYRQRSLPVDSFPANPFGLYQVHGNVSEWVADCWRSSYQGMTADGAAATTGDCGRRVLRGGSWYDGPQLLRAAARIGFYPGYRSNKIGFRVARPL